MLLPAALRPPIEAALGSPITGARALSGGSINQAARVETAHGVFFVKWNHGAPPAFFEREARGLALLRETGAIRVPAVIAASEAAADHPAYLILEWLEESSPASGRAFAAGFGHALAALHRHRADQHGLDHDNYIGELPQSNQRHPRWVDFLREERLRPQMALARRRGRLNPARERLLDRLCERLGDLLGSEEHPALLHGDLWGGNFLTTGNGPALIDPAVYYGHREMEIAMTELFGGFPVGFLAAYHEAFPLEAGHERRRSLCQLYPLLVHLNLFGERYGQRVDEICRVYVG